MDEEEDDEFAEDEEESGPLTVQARTTGPYSLISLQPLGNVGNPGQPVTVANVRFLRAHELWANLAELTVLKSDDLAARPALERLSAECWEVPRPDAPESLNYLCALFATLGFAVILDPRPHHVALRLIPADDEAARALSSGVVSKPETIHYRTYKPVRGGIFCEAVFGLQDSEEDNRTQFGHIELPYPIIPRIWRMRKRSMLAEITGLRESDLEAVIMFKKRAVREGTRIVLEDYSAAPFNARKPEPYEPDPTTGPEAVSALLEPIEPSRFPPALRGRTDVLFRNTVLVYPPDLRPLVLLESGNFATADVNDLYRRVINRTNRLKALVKLNAPLVIIVNERKMLQEAMDALMANTLERRKIKGTSKRPLLDIMSCALREVGMECKRVDFSGRAPVRVDRTIDVTQCAVPGKIFQRLMLREDGPILVTNLADASGRMMALLPVTHDQDVIALRPEAFDALAMGTDGSACIVHRPLGADAIAESRGILGKVLALPPTEHVGWVDSEDALARLLDAAYSGEAIELDWSRGLLIGGCRD